MTKVPGGNGAGGPPAYDYQSARRSSSEYADFYKEAAEFLKKNFPQLEQNIPAWYGPLVADTYARGEAPALFKGKQTAVADPSLHTPAGVVQEGADPTPPEGSHRPHQRGGAAVEGEHEGPSGKEGAEYWRARRDERVSEVERRDFMERRVEAWHVDHMKKFEDGRFDDRFQRHLFWQDEKRADEREIKGDQNQLIKADQRRREQEAEERRHRESSELERRTETDRGDRSRLERDSDDRRRFEADNERRSHEGRGERDNESRRAAERDAEKRATERRDDERRQYERDQERQRQDRDAERRRIEADLLNRRRD